jgi:ABC-2 type transport system ATP-binding protein
MSIVKTENLCKHFKILNRREGLIGAAKDLFSQNYRIVKAVDNITLDIQAGEIVAFLGSNGAGKSTMIKMLTGALEPSAGSLFVDGNIPFKNRKKNAQNMGVVFGQRTQLWWDLPVIESFKLLKEIYKIEKSIYNENLNIFDEVANLKVLYNVPVRNLSLGQRMLCDIAAAFLHNPKIIFLDEPTIGLDVSIKCKVRQMVKNLNELRKTTVILTSHDMGDIEALCRRIIIIDKGVIIFDDGIDKVNKMFGAHRTLKMQFKNSGEISEKFIMVINSKFKNNNEVQIGRIGNDWVDLVINQDNVQLIDILNFVMNEFSIKDIEIEDMHIESIVKKIYEGELL